MKRSSIFEFTYVSFLYIVYQTNYDVLLQLHWNTHVLSHLISDVIFGYERSTTANTEENRNGYSSVSSYAASSAIPFSSMSDSPGRSHLPSTSLSTNVSGITVHSHDNSTNSNTTDYNSSASNNDSFNWTTADITQELSTLSRDNYSYSQAGEFTLDSENNSSTMHNAQYPNGSTGYFDNPTSTYITDGIEIIIICKYTVDVIHHMVNSPWTQE